MRFKQPAPRSPLRVPKSDAGPSKKAVKKAAVADQVTQLLLDAPLKKKGVKGATELAGQVALQSRFGKQSGTINDMIEMGNSDGASSLIIKSLIQSLVEILPAAEKRLLDSNAKEGIYGFNALLCSTRELLGDLQALRDRSTLGQSTVDKSVRPAFMEIGVQIVTAFTLLQDSAKARMTPEDFREFRRTVEDTKKGLADYIMAQYRDVSEQVIKSLG